MKKLLCYLIICSLVFSSCNFNSHYTDKPLDRDEAERITVKFYYLLRDKNYNDTYKLFSPRFLEVTNTSKIEQIFKTSDEELGEIKDQSLVSWKTNVVKGSNPISEYLLVYDVKRSKFNSKETIRLEKENDTIKILSYNVQSDGFIEPAIK